MLLFSWGEPMKKLLYQLWNDEDGFVLSTELVLISSVLGIGVITGATSARDQLVQEMIDTGRTITSITQQYRQAALTGQPVRRNSTADNAAATGQGAVENAIDNMNGVMLQNNPTVDSPGVTSAP
jgi:hypothetical protein